jgi:hypothetical protein
VCYHDLGGLRGVDEPLAVTPDIYASARLARTQARLPLNGNSALVTLQRAGRRAAEPRKALFFNFISRVPLEIGSDLLMSGPQLFFFCFGEDFKSGTVRNIKGCVCDLAVRADFFKKIDQFFSRPRRSEVTT